MTTEAIRPTTAAIKATNNNVFIIQFFMIRFVIVLKLVSVTLAR